MRYYFKYIGVFKTRWLPAATEFRKCQIKYIKNGEKVVFPYETYDSLCVFSKWGSGIIETTTAVIDFNGWGSVTYK